MRCVVASRGCEELIHQLKIVRRLNKCAIHWIVHGYHRPTLIMGAYPLQACVRRVQGCNHTATLCMLGFLKGPCHKTHKEGGRTCTPLAIMNAT
jgi:hypothetical protein